MISVVTISIMQGFEDNERQRFHDNYFNQNSLAHAVATCTRSKLTPPLYLILDLLLHCLGLQVSISLRVLLCYGTTEFVCCLLGIRESAPQRSWETNNDSVKCSFVNGCLLKFV